MKEKTRRRKREERTANVNIRIKDIRRNIRIAPIPLIHPQRPNDQLPRLQQRGDTRLRQIRREEGLPPGSASASHTARTRHGKSAAVASHGELSGSALTVGADGGHPEGGDAGVAGTGTVEGELGEVGLRFGEGGGVGRLVCGSEKGWSVNARSSRILSSFEVIAGGRRERKGKPENVLKFIDHPPKLLTLPLCLLLCPFPPLSNPLPCPC